jgi:UDP-N-acetylglucosamine/UDP-N-acetylgalactosamine diphosphorylase
MMKQIEKLMKKGVRIPNPQSVEIGDEVDVERISGEGVVIHSGCKIYGHTTLILRGAKLGYEAPVTVENCQIGPEVSLKGGFFQKAVFLEKASMGLGAHVRAGSILEEEASGAHTVGLKQTLLFPFVTLGSLINFCDCFMSGGTSRKDHSEVGSSYIHFNYTPNQDKATPSLIGDVPRGVMLNQRPIFLGGQGGLVGPCRLAYGTVIAAGTICRKDELRPRRLIFEGGRSGNLPFTPGMYVGNKRIMKNNRIYLANLMALMQWYTHVRAQFASDAFPDALLEGLRDKLNMATEERIRRLRAFCLVQENKLSEDWPRLEAALEKGRNESGNISLRDTFLEKIHSGISASGKDYIAVIKRLDDSAAALGTKWLQGIVDGLSERFQAA